MRIFKIACSALAAAVLCTPLALMAAQPAHAIYACFGSGTVSSDPFKSGCPIKADLAQLSSLSLGGTDVIQIASSGIKTGKTLLSAINILKLRDASSALLLADASNGTALPEVSIAIYTPESTSSTTPPSGPTYNILLTNVIVTSWNWNADGTSGNTARFSESLSLAFQKITLVDNITHQTVTWNTATNSPNAIEQ